MSIQERSLELFADDKVDMRVLKERAVGMRWGSVPEGTIPLTSADPDFKPAPEISKAIIEYLKGGYFPYASNTGSMRLRETLAQGLRDRKGESIPPAYILPIDSAAAVLDAIAAAVLEPGDEAIIFDPVDLLFGIAIRRAKGKVVYFPSVHNENGWVLDNLDDYVTDKTRMICLCNPHNPMGYLYSTEELRAIAEFADRHGLWIMNDEIWSDIVFSEKAFISINSLGPELNRRTISCYGYSKGFGLAGLRAAFAYTLNEQAYQKIAAAATGHVYGVDVLTQVAMEAAFENCFYWVDAFVAHLQRNRDYIYERFAAMPLIKATKQEATFVTFPDIRATGLTSTEFVAKMREEQKVALVPGTEFWFGPRAEGYVRLCYSTSRAILTEALDRIEAGLVRIANV
ncbi:putative aminotransferase YugH [Clostridia bacterium]|nr:putative aminotransferase YugH [Clostridia bacterium]